MSTTAELKKYYADLLIAQYVNKPRAHATVEAQVDPVIMDQLPLDVQDAFTIDAAVGVQLDVLGKYVGVARVARTFTEQITLSDADYRMLIKMKITQNNSGSSLYEIQSLLHIYFPGAILVFDYQNMQMDYLFDAAFGSAELAEVFVRQGLLPKPMGVQLGALIYSPSINNFFGFRTYELAGHNITGFNSYTDYQMDWPFLSYTDAIYA
jgi:hypothetical protein